MGLLELLEQRLRSDPRAAELVLGKQYGQPRQLTQDQLPSFPVASPEDLRKGLEGLQPTQPTQMVPIDIYDEKGYRTEMRPMEMTPVPIYGEKGFRYEMPKFYNPEPVDPAEKLRQLLQRSFK